MRILIVDDNVETANSIKLLLQFKGHETIAVYNSNKVLTLSKSFNPDIILLDIGMPDIDGYEVAQQLRTSGFSKRVVALTGYGKPEDIQQAIDAGFNGHVVKPITIGELEHIFCQY